MSEIEERVARAIEGEITCPKVAMTPDQIFAAAARAAIAAMPQGEPAAWQYRSFAWGEWGQWFQLNQSVESFKESFAGKIIAEGRIELRPLYATSVMPVSEPGVREATIEECARIADACDLPMHNGQKIVVADAARVIASAIRSRPTPPEVQS